MKRHAFALRTCLTLALACGLTTALHAQVGAPPLPEVDWAQKLGNQVPLETRFTRSDGTDVALAELVSGRPVILALVYYECPMLCNLVLGGLVQSLRTLSLDVGDEFDVVVLSIDAGETPELARANRDGVLERYDREGTQAGWHFLVGDENAIEVVTGAVGFQFTYVPETDEYAHAAGISVLTADGELSRIFFGTEYAPRDLKFGLMDASDGGIGSPIDKFVLRCFQYDPARGKYGFAIMTVIRIAGAITVGLIVLAIVRMIRRDRSARDRKRSAVAT